MLFTSAVKRVLLPVLGGARPRLAPLNVVESPPGIVHRVDLLSGGPPETTTTTTTPPHAEVVAAAQGLAPANDTVVVVPGEAAALPSYTYEDDATRQEWERMLAPDAPSSSSNETGGPGETTSVMTPPPPVIVAAPGSGDSGVAFATIQQLDAFDAAPRSAFSETAPDAVVVPPSISDEWPPPVVPSYPRRRWRRPGETTASRNPLRRRERRRRRGVVASPDKQWQQQQRDATTSTTTTHAAARPRSSTSSSSPDDGAMVSELSKFTLPLLLVWLSSPLLSLADSGFIGALRSTAELAALGPACSLCDSFYFSSTFVGVVTTSAVATACARGDESTARAATLAGCVAAGAIGLALTWWLALGGGAEATLRLFVDPADAAAATMLPEAAAYVKARVIGFAPACVSSALQAAALGRRSVKATLVAAFAASLANLVGDAALVPSHGLVGAAAATAVAQFVSLGVMLRAAKKDKLITGPVASSREEQPRRKPKSGLLSSLLVGGGTTGDRRTETTTAGALFRPPRQLVVLPRLPRPAAAPATRRALVDVGVQGLPVLATLLAKCAVLSSLAFSATKSASARGDIAAMAAQQILTTLYLLFAPVGDALSSTVQTFLPRALGSQQHQQRGGGTGSSASSAEEATAKAASSTRKKKPRRAVVMTPAARRVVTGAARAALVLGVLNAVLAFGAPTLLPFAFSRDEAVAAALVAHAPFLGLSLLLHAASASAEGTMLAVRDTKVLSAFYALDAVAVTAAFVALAATAAPLAHVWGVFVAYQVVRAAQFLGRVRFTVLRKQGDAPQTTAGDMTSADDAGDAAAAALAKKTSGRFLRRGALGRFRLSSSENNNPTGQPRRRRPRPAWMPAEPLARDPPLPAPAA